MLNGPVFAQNKSVNDLSIDRKAAFFGIAPLGSTSLQTNTNFWSTLSNQTTGLMNGTINFPYLVPLRDSATSTESMQTISILDAPYTRANLYQLADGYGTKLGEAYRSIATYSNPRPYDEREATWNQISRNVTDVIWFTGSRLRDVNLTARAILGSGNVGDSANGGITALNGNYTASLGSYQLTRAFMALAYGINTDSELLANTKKDVIFSSADPTARVFKENAGGQLSLSELLPNLRDIAGNPFKIGNTNVRPFEVYSYNPSLGSVPAFYASNFNTGLTDYNSNWGYMIEPDDTSGGYGIDGQIGSASYSSGHAIYGWYGAWVLGASAPVSFQQMQVRGAENALGRVIGGWHWPTDIIGSRTLSYYGIAQMMAGEAGYFGDAGPCPTPPKSGGNFRCIPSGLPGTSGQQVTISAPGQPGDYRSVLMAAKADMASSLAAACGVSLAACAADDTSRFSNKETNRRFYEATLTLGLPKVWSESDLNGYVLDFNNFAPATPYLAWNTQTNVATEQRVAANAGYLLYTRFPYLTQAQRNEVLTTTVVSDAEGRGTFLDNGSAFGAYSLINLFKASDGYGSFRATVDITMNAADGGFSAVDTWSNDISGTGGLIKRGTGVLTLSGNNTFTGPITIYGGALNITGRVRSSGLTADAGIIGGTGSLPATTINTGAIHAPGNSIGTQTIDGNYSLNNATLALEFQGPTSDLVSVNGNVNAFSGTAQLAPFGGGTPWPSFNYTLVAAPNSPAFTGPNSLTLDDALVTSALLRSGAQLRQEVDNDPRTFDLSWQPLTATGATSAAMQTLGNANPQAMAVSGVIDRSIQQLQANSNANAGGTAIGTTGFTQNQAMAAGLSADYIQSVSDLIGLSTGSALTNAVNAIAPEPYAAFLSVGLDTLRQQRSTILAQAGQCHATGWVINQAKSNKAAASSTAKRPPLCVYAQAGNTTGVVNGSQGLDSYNSGIFSTGLGLETSLSKRWTLGLAYGYGSSYANNFSGANAFVNANVNGVSVYSVYRPDQRWAISSLLGYSNFTINSSRTIPGIGTAPLTGGTSANGVTAAVEATYLLPLTAPTAKTQVLAKPLLGLAWGGYQQTGFNETGGGFSQSVQGRAANSLLGTVGVEFTTSPLPLNAQGTTSIIPRLAVAYQVDPLANNVQNKTVDSSFVGAPGAGTLSTEGQNLGVNNLNVAGGVTVQVADQVSIYATASYLLLSNANQFSYNGGVRVKF